MMRRAAVLLQNAASGAEGLSLPFATSVNWFPGHMAKATREIGERLSTIDLVLEVRDARIPFSSANPELSGLMGASKRVVVYNKADLSNGYLHQHLRKYHETLGERCVFTNAAKGDGVPKLIGDSIRSCDSGYRVAGSLMIVVGVPNVGKSTIINEIRHRAKTKSRRKRSKTSKTGARPGVTRQLGAATMVNNSPPVYLVDTPGIMLPRVDDAEVGLKLALTGALPDATVPLETLVHYFLYVARSMGNTKYVSVLDMDGPTDDPRILLDHVSRRIGALRPGGDYDHELAARHFLQDFRSGRLGRLTLDQIPVL